MQQDKEKEIIDKYSSKPNLSFKTKDGEKPYVDKDVEESLDSKIQAIRDYMNNNDGKGKSSEEKDELYKQAQVLWKEYRDCLIDSKFNMYLDKDENMLLFDIIVRKSTYDVNTVFMAIELKKVMNNISHIKSQKDDEFSVIKVTADELAYMYHIISKYEIKGLTKEAYSYSSILYVISDITKLTNYYRVCTKTLSTDIQDWVALFDENATTDKDTSKVSAEKIEVDNAKTATDVKSEEVK